WHWRRIWIAWRLCVVTFQWFQIIPLVHRLRLPRSGILLPLMSLTVLSCVGSSFGNRRPVWSGDEAVSRKVGFAPAEPLVTVVEYFPKLSTPTKRFLFS